MIRPLTEGERAVCPHCGGPLEASSTHKHISNREARVQGFLDGCVGLMNDSRWPPGQEGHAAYHLGHREGEHYDSDDDYEEEEYDESEECGRWRNGKLVTQCENAGTEWCDWSCPIGLPHRTSRQRG